jgi:hypothetical protein
MPSVDQGESPTSREPGVAPSSRTRLAASQSVELPRSGGGSGVVARQEVGWTIRKPDGRPPDSSPARGSARVALPLRAATDGTIQDQPADRQSGVSTASAAPIPRPRSTEPAADEQLDISTLPASSRGHWWRLPEPRWVGLLSLPFTIILVGLLGLGVLFSPEEFARLDQPDQPVSSLRLAASPEAARPAAGSAFEGSPDPNRGNRASPVPRLPGDALVQSQSGSPRAPVGSNRAAGAPTALRMLFDEQFADNQMGWPSNPQSTGWLGDNVYSLFARQPSQFVALGAPLPGSLHDVVVTAIFRKVGGPPGGGYGVIVRDQGPGPRDGSSQSGRFYVLEASDRGEVGIWRRENDRWIDLLPWTGSEAVRQGTGTNQLTAQAVGQRLTFLVNGTQVASLEDEVLADGRVGVFIGGDFNEVALESFRVEVPQ